jgi:hypothetical protein
MNASSSPAPAATGQNLAVGPGLGEMIGVYETCLRIRDVSKQQLALSDDMALIAINAEIAAAKSVTNQDAFMILANETGKIARHMSGHVAKVLEHADSLARQALLGVVNARRLDKMTLALEGIRRPENAVPVQRQAIQLAAYLADIMQDILASQTEVEAVRQSLAKQHQRVSRIITYFRIEASRDTEHGSYFQNIAEDLSELIALAQSISHGLHEALKAGGTARTGSPAA